MIAPYMEAETFRIAMPHKRLYNIVRHIIIGVFLHNPESRTACLGGNIKHIVLKYDIFALASPVTVGVI